VDAGQGANPGDAPACPDDDPAVDLLAQDRVGAADVAGALGGDGGRFDPEPALAERGRRVQDDLVPGRPAVLQGEVEVALLDRETQDVSLEDAERLFQQLLTRLVAVQNRHDGGRHRSESYGAVHS